MALIWPFKVPAASNASTVYLPLLNGAVARVAICAADLDRAGTRRAPLSLVTLTSPNTPSPKSVVSVGLGILLILRPPITTSSPKSGSVRVKLTPFVGAASGSLSMRSLLEQPTRMLANSKSIADENFRDIKFIFCHCCVWNMQCPIHYFIDWIRS